MPAKQDLEKTLENGNENPNAFKLWIDRRVLTRIGKEISNVYPEFDRKRLIAIAPKLDSLELKPRVLLIRDELRALLPPDFLQALKILLASTKAGKLSGFTLWPYTEFIQTFGLAHREPALAALATLTELFTAEFAVRPFLQKETTQTLNFLKKCARSSNPHQRRWASEGSRPRLPWGIKLDIFIKEPSRTLEILELLKNDDERYVRKSVANHLNDISKDHSALVVKTLKRWNKNADESHREKISWITRHALRTLIKRGDVGALSAIGASANAKVKVSNLNLGTYKFETGDRIQIQFQLRSLAKKNQRVVVDYVIHFMKSNGKTTPKVFKLKAFDLAAGGRLEITKAHHLKKITTRRYYTGAHALEIQVNGTVHARAEWLLI